MKMRKFKKIIDLILFHYFHYIIEKNTKILAFLFIDPKNIKTKRKYFIKL